MVLSVNTTNITLLDWLSAKNDIPSFLDYASVILFGSDRFAVVSNESNQPVQAGLGNDSKIRAVDNDCKANEKLFECGECCKQFSRAGNLKRHKAMIHTDYKLVHKEERRFECKMCNETFKERHHLGGHMITHTNEKTQKCNVCNKEFKHFKDLRRHKLTHGNVRFQCKECGRNFTQKCNLKRHMRAHKNSGEEPYSTMSSLITSIAENITVTEILITKMIIFAGL
ncbi:unnamed protein product [Cercopithifilaria johnstoni]|uniref:C2H2-type domain-containing protein n=1 Tax=Cercopithifilaria johnstoni TaxID=2874296 RepID=A0A8J2MBC2_9BILA|nr:unnamed protein product [Cercopithifilaria johnstoni]